MQVETIGEVDQPLDTAECLTDMMLLLPGTLVVPSGTELGLNPGSIFPWDHSNSNAGKLFSIFVTLCSIGISRVVVIIGLW